MRYMLLILTFFIFQNIEVSGDTTPNPRKSSISKQKLVEVVDKLCSDRDFSPIISPNQTPFKVTILGPDFDNENDITFIKGEFYELKKEPITAIFVVSKSKGNEMFFAKCLYMMNGNHMGPILFYDVLNDPFFQTSHKKALEIFKENNAFVYISNEPINENSRNQTWTFYSPGQKYEVFLTLKDDGKGGTFFGFTNQKIEREPDKK